MIVLGIDTSCDDTSVGIVNNLEVLANVISSQDDLHAAWGGVVPNIARRAHQENFPAVYQQALADAGVEEKDIEAIAVTYGHGLAVSLEVGLQEAIKLAQKLAIPLYPINHSEGHLVANFAQTGEEPGLSPDDITWPALAVLVAGGQTQLVKVEALGKYQIIGETVDDAIGEAFDKSARLLGLDYPGGPQLAALAEQGNSQAYDLPRPMRQSKDLNVSYAGLKTAFLRLVRSLIDNPETDKIPSQLTTSQKADLAASFQAAAIETILIKVKKALAQTDYQHIFLGGGVAANQKLRQDLTTLAQKNEAQLHIPPGIKLCRDNAAMIALAGFLASQRVKPATNLDNLDRDPQLRMDE